MFWSPSEGGVIFIRCLERGFCKSYFKQMLCLKGVVFRRIVGSVCFWYLVCLPNFSLPCVELTVPHYICPCPFNDKISFGIVVVAQFLHTRWCEVSDHIFIYITCSLLQPLGTARVVQRSPLQGSKIGKRISGFQDWILEPCSILENAHGNLGLLVKIILLLTKVSDKM